MPALTAKPALPAKARSLIRRLGLQPHPEGGYYREIHRSAERVGTGRGRRAAITTIYFLLARGQKSVLHRVLSDEIWHWYEGAPLRLLHVGADFRFRETVVLGPSAKGSVQAFVIPRLAWQAAESAGDYTLVGCSVGPGFDFADFTLLRDDARAAAKLAKAHPDLSAWI
jgi:predicted cupin superfamily sugar epimerase